MLIMLSSFLFFSSLLLACTNSDLKKYAAKKATTYIYYLPIFQIRLVTPHATNRDMLLYRKPRLWGCYYSRHVTNQDVLVLATIRYIEQYFGDPSICTTYSFFLYRSKHILKFRNCPVKRSWKFEWEFTNTVAPFWLCSNLINILFPDAEVFPARKKEGEWRS